MDNPCADPVVKIALDPVEYLFAEITPPKLCVRINVAAGFTAVEA